MRIFLFTLLLAGCDAGLEVSDAGLSWCVSECGSCGAGESCVRWNNVRDRAACMRSCTVTQDCPTGMHCVDVNPVFGATPGRWCLPDDGCAGDSVMCDVPVRSGCVDSRTMVRYFNNSTLCGRELIDCASGCSRPDLGDGPDRGHCN